MVVRLNPVAVTYRNNSLVKPLIISKRASKNSLNKKQSLAAKIKF